MAKKTGRKTKPGKATPRPSRSRVEMTLARLGLPLTDAHDLPDSGKRFPDGAQYRLEIPTTEGPRALKAVIDAAEE